MGPDQLNQYRNNLRAGISNKYMFTFAGLILAPKQNPARRYDQKRKQKNKNTRKEHRPY